MGGGYKAIIDFKRQAQLIVYLCRYKEPILNIPAF